MKQYMYHLVATACVRLASTHGRIPLSKQDCVRLLIDNLREQLYTAKQQLHSMYTLYTRITCASIVVHCTLIAMFVLICC
jgi:hypothetical protein